MAKSRFRHPGKHAAYETALQAAANLSMHDLYHRDNGMTLVVNRVHSLHISLPFEHARQVAAKALRVERGVRKRKK